jgi:hypothetical protein
MLGVPPPQLPTLAGALELLGRELANRLQHPQPAGLPAPYEAVLDERLQRLEIRLADLLGRRQRERPREDGEPAEDRPLLVAEQVATPFDRRPKRALALRRFARAAREERQPSLEAPE